MPEFSLHIRSGIRLEDIVGDAASSYCDRLKAEATGGTTTSGVYCGAERPTGRDQSHLESYGRSAMMFGS
jgi:hypothetical protein